MGVRVESIAFKELMSRFPSGVAVVTTTNERGIPYGLTCSSLCSLSLDPPLLLVCIRNGSQTLLTIQQRRVLAINLLHDRGQEAAELFAAPVTDRFERLPWSPTAHWRLPSLTCHAHVVAECRLWDCRVIGDHTILAAEVVGVTSMADANPLLYGLRQYAAWPAAT